MISGIDAPSNRAPHTFAVERTRFGVPLTATLGGRRPTAAASDPTGLPLSLCRAYPED